MLVSALSEKITLLTKKFSQLETRDEKYKFILLQAKSAITLPQSKRTPNNLVSGCQSILYLGTLQESPTLIFAVHSESLISLGLASLLLQVYNEENAEVIASSSPQFLEQLGINHTLLSPGRAGGVQNMFRKMQYHAIQLIAQNTVNAQNK